MNAIKKFLKKIKLFFGIGTVKVKLEVPENFKETDTEIKGSVLLIGKSDQKVNKIKLRMYEKYSKKNKEGQEIKKEFTLGEMEISKVMDIKEGEEKKVEFTLPFELMKSKNDRMKDSGGVVGALGSLGAFMDNEQSIYMIAATADVDAASIDPNDVATLVKVKA